MQRVERVTASEGSLSRVTPGRVKLSAFVALCLQRVSIVFLDGQPALKYSFRSDLNRVLCKERGERSLLLNASSDFLARARPITRRGEV